jgi:FixJ family two-component response regulator
MSDHPIGSVVAVVDDDRGVLESLGLLLESADHEVRLFASAAALLESGCLAEIDGLVSDIGMPGMDGFELLRAVRAARPMLPIILITGQSDLGSQSPPIGLGEYRLLKKPLDGREFLAIVNDSLRGPDLPAPRS